jgi:hypothetical protein
LTNISAFDNWILIISAQYKFPYVGLPPNPVHNSFFSFIQISKSEFLSMTVIGVELSANRICMYIRLRRYVEYAPRRFRLLKSPYTMNIFRIVLLLSLLMLSGCLTLDGPKTVPGTSIHQYTTNCDQTPAWSVTSGATAGFPTGAATTVSVHWGAGPGNGSVSVLCRGETKTLAVQIVSVGIAADTFNATAPVIYMGVALEGKLMAGFDPAGNAVYYGADITLTGAGKNKITAGIVQVLRAVPVLMANYADGTQLRARFVKQPPWLDVSTGPPPAWYVPGVATTTGTNGIIAASDAPQTGWPRVNASGAALASGVSHWVFDAYTAAQTSDAPSVYTIIGHLQWHFIANINRSEQPGYVVGGSGIGPNAAPFFTIVSSGATVDPTTGLRARHGLASPNRTFSQ